MEAATPQAPAGNGALRPDQLALGNLTLDSGVFLVRIANRPVELSYYEFELMRVLAAQPDRIIPYDGITSALWGASGHSKTRRLQVLVHRLRSKLSGSHPYSIETVRGRGYGLVAKLRTAS